MFSEVKTAGGRFDRMERTDWIDMDKIHSANVLVAGAGALGNETVKCLALAGFRKITIADPDLVEESNLSRCVLFRSRDIGRNKADAAAAAARDLDADCEAVSFNGRVQLLDLLPFGIYIGCLDNISARLHLNSHAAYYRTPYIDGSIDGFRGRMHIVLGNGACLECGMNRTHLDELHRTFSCMPGIVREDRRIISSGVTTVSVIAAMCVREAIKIVCGCEHLCSRGVSYYDGISGRVDILALEVNARCPNHGDNRCQLG